MGGVLRVRPDERVAGPTTPGMAREQAIATDGLWAGFVTTEPGMASDWHHHGGHRTVFYVLAGRLAIESGPDGAERVEAAPGDFVLVPEGSVHRESTAGGESASVVVIRVGSGESVVNVEGPGPA